MRNLSIAFLTAFLVVITITSPSMAKPKTVPDLEKRLEGIKKIAVVMPEIRIYNVSLLNVEEGNEDWSAVAERNFLNGLSGFLGQDSNVFIINAPADEELQEVRQIYSAMSYSINYFKRAKPEFDYCLGPIDAILARYDADALLFGSGFIQVYSSERIFFEGIAFFFGSYIAPPQRFYSVALLDRTGEIIWFNSTRYGIGWSELKENNTDALFQDLLSGFPVRIISMKLKKKDYAVESMSPAP